MKRYYKWFLATVLIIPTLTFAIGSPVTLLQNVANEMIAQLQANKSQLKNHAIIHRIVNQVLVPHIAINVMAGTVVGRQYWFGSSASQQAEFVSQFKKLVINTYANALSSYDGDKVTVYPLRGSYEGQRVLRVRSMIVRRSGQRIPINYNVLNVGGTWKVYDFSIEGVSIIQSYRSQFSSVLAQGGMPALLKRLQHYNTGRR